MSLSIVTCPARGDRCVYEGRPESTPHMHEGGDVVNDIAQLRLKYLEDILG